MKNPAMKTTDKSHQTEAADGAADHADWRWADPKTLKVNPAFQSLIPMQSKGEHMALEESIKAEGCRDPLLVWKGQERRPRRPHPPRAVHRAQEAGEGAGGGAAGREGGDRVHPANPAAAPEPDQGSHELLPRRGVQRHQAARGGSRRGRQPKGQSDPTTSTALDLAEKYGVAEKTIKRDGVFAQVIDKIVADYGDPRSSGNSWVRT